MGLSVHSKGMIFQTPLDYFTTALFAPRIRDFISGANPTPMPIAKAKTIKPIIAPVEGMGTDAITDQSDEYRLKEC